MKRLPRSEAFWVIIFIAMSSMVVVGAVINLARGDRGKRPPAYQSAPPPILSPPAEGTLADPRLVDLPPISDASFERLHRLTRALTPGLMNPEQDRRLLRYTADPSALNNLRDARGAYVAQLSGYRASSPRDMQVARPDPDSLQTQTSARISYVSLSPQSEAPTVRLSVNYFWEQIDGRWLIRDIQAQLVS